MATRTVEKIIQTERHTYEVRRMPDAELPDKFQIYRVSGGAEEYIGICSLLSGAVDLVRRSN